MKNICNLFMYTYIHRADHILKPKNRNKSKIVFYESVRELKPSPEQKRLKFKDPHFSI